MSVSKSKTKPVPRKAGGRPRKAGQADGNNVEIAYNWIKSQILSGNFKAGEVLLQGALAKQCNTSRGPIREALRLLQNQGLVETETNQRGRVASFTAHDLEQTIASGIIIAGGAISCHKASWSAVEIKRIEKLIDEHEALSRKLAEGVGTRHEIVNQRLFVYHELIMAICAQGGSLVQKILAGHFDRIVIFRQMTGIRAGNDPEFPLGADMHDLRRKINARDAGAVALLVIATMAELGRFALDQMGEYHLGAEIDKAVTFVRGALGVATDSITSREIRTKTNQSVNVELKGAETLIWTFSGD